MQLCFWWCRATLLASGLLSALLPWPHCTHGQLSAFDFLFLLDPEKWVFPEVLLIFSSQKATSKLMVYSSSLTHTTCWMKWLLHDFQVLYCTSCAWYHPHCGLMYFCLCVCYIDDSLWWVVVVVILPPTECWTVAAEVFVSELVVGCHWHLQDRN